MGRSNETSSAVAEAIFQARAAMQNGRMNDYQPVLLSRADEERAAPSSCWGPAHKK